MATAEVNTNKLKQAIEKFGSLEKAVNALESYKQALENQIAHLKQSVGALTIQRDKLSSEVENTQNQLSQKEKRLELQAERILQDDRQYQLFESFLAMVASAPSATTSVEDLIATLKTLLSPGWQTPMKAEDLRSLFIRNIMGDYLKCFHCDNCGASFIVNKEPYFKYYGNFYQCPACHYSPQVKADDSFIKAMISEKQLETVRRVEELQKEYETLKPFKALFGFTCEVCKKPINEWTEKNVHKGINGLGWAHIGCLNSPAGQIMQFTKIIGKSG
jgi:predicted RNA-binding Zn-ribbon protein involved in translation (DUF1610 family)/FtsZ-binding cell division protein ZapB